MGILDICVIAIVVVAVLIGIFRGFMKSFLGLFGDLIAIAAGFFVGKPVAAYLTTNFGSSLQDKICTFLSGKGDIFSSTLAADAEAALTNALETLHIPSSFHPLIFNNIDFSSFGDKTLAEILAPGISGFIFLISAFILTTLVVKIVLKILARLLKKHLHNRFLKKVDRSLGAIFALIQAAVFISVIFLVLSFAVTLPSSVFASLNDWVTADLAKPLGIAKFIFTKNPIVLLFQLLIK